MCHPRRCASLVLTLGLLSQAAAAQEPDRLTPGDHELTLTHGERERWALVHVPPPAAKPARLPLVIVFHGGGGEPYGMQKLTGGLDRLADREGFLVVYPAGTGPFARRLLTWNAGSCCGGAARDAVDDVGFTVALLRQLAARAPVDPTRVYASGLSNGAMMSYRLAIDASDRVAAIAPVAGAMMVVLPARPTRPVPVIHFHSVDDPRALYGGGLGPPFPFTNSRVQHPPLEKTLAWWVEQNGCAAQPELGPLQSGPPGSDSAAHTARAIRWGPGPDGAEVVHWKLTGAGHVWPGGPGYATERMVGPPTLAVNANVEMWAFFQRFQRKDAPPLLGN